MFHGLQIKSRNLINDFGVETTNWVRKWTSYGNAVIAVIQLNNRAIKQKLLQSNPQTVNQMSNTSKHTHMTIDMTTDNCMPTANCKHNNERWKRKAIARESHESAIKLRLHKSKSLIGKLGNCNSRCVVSAARAQQCSRIYSLFSSLTSPAE